jgi:hypothetical protein
MEEVRKALKAEVLSKKRDVSTNLVPYYEALISRHSGARIPLDINWESFTKAKRADLAVSTLHIWGSFFVLHRIASVIEEICSPAAFPFPFDSTTSSSSLPSLSLYPGGRATIASRLVRVIIQNDDKRLKGKDKVTLKPYLRKRKKKDKADGAGEPIRDEMRLARDEAMEGDESAEEEVWVLTVKGNFGQGALGGFSRKRLLSTLTRRLKLITPHHKALLDHFILPRCNKDIAQAIANAEGGREREEALHVGTTKIQVEIDWETLDEEEDERALRNLAAWGGYYSLTQVSLAFCHLVAASSSPFLGRRPNWGEVVRKVVVRHVPGQDSTRKRCSVDHVGGVLYIDGVWETDGWQAGFTHTQIAEVPPPHHYYYYYLFTYLLK